MVGPDTLRAEEINSSLNGNLSALATAVLDLLLWLYHPSWGIWLALLVSTAESPLMTPHLFLLFNALHSSLSTTAYALTVEPVPLDV